MNNFKLIGCASYGILGYMYRADAVYPKKGHEWETLKKQVHHITGHRIFEETDEDVNLEPSNAPKIMNSVSEEVGLDDGSIDTANVRDNSKIKAPTAGPRNAALKAKVTLKPVVGGKPLSMVKKTPSDAVEV